KGPNKTYLLVSHLNYFDTPDSKDIFYSFLNLSKKIDQSETKLFIQNPLYFNPKLKSYIISEMLSYIFDNKLETTFVDLEKTQPLSKEEIHKIITDNHSTSIAGHPGFHKTYKRIKEIYKWHNMKRDIKKFNKNCEKCQQDKRNRHPIKAPMHTTSTSDRPFEKLFLDIVGPLPLTENENRFILTLQDDLTKFS